MNHTPPLDEAPQAGAVRPRASQGRRPTAAPDLQLVDSSDPIERRVYDSLRCALMSFTMLPGQMLTSRSLGVADQCPQRA